MSDRFYKTEFTKQSEFKVINDCRIEKSYGFQMFMAMELAIKYNKKIMLGLRPSGVIRGCVAVRKRLTNSFVISQRAKIDIHQFVCVDHVDHFNKIVHVDNKNKASLNAPMIDWIFRTCPNVNAVVHWHEKIITLDDIGINKLYVFDYQDPGSVDDSIRDFSFLKLGCDGFYIKNHGFFKVL